MALHSLLKNLRRSFDGRKPLRLALLGDTATQLLAKALRATGYDYGYDLLVYEGGYGQIEQEAFDAGSELYRFRPDAILLYQSAEKLLTRYRQLAADEKATLAEGRIELIRQLTGAIGAHSGATIICYNYAELNDGVFGSFAGRHEASFPFQLRKLNYRLMEFAAAQPGFLLCDLAAVQTGMGRPQFHQCSLYTTASMAIAPDALPEVAARTLDVIAAVRGALRKCVVLDLDNTLWGGIIGDDGVEQLQVGELGIGRAFTDFQHWLLQLKQRGILLAVCSKNDEAVAQAPFRGHPDMVLRLEDFAVFIANWDNKADNIRRIQDVLRIGFDSMVFLDDNPFERSLVREHIPGICVPELPEDPAEYTAFLAAANLFETAAYSGEDAQRTTHYQAEAKRSATGRSFTNLDEFLKSLCMRSAVAPFNNFNAPRAAQLSQRSNQFNLRTIRYTEADVARLAADPLRLTFTFTLDDRFGENGLICIVVLQKVNPETLFIENWLMSCRVLRRGMEQFVLNTVAGEALAAGFSELRGDYVPTGKNGLVRNHYRDLGFPEVAGNWLMDLASYQPHPTFVQTKTAWTEA